MFVHTWHTLNRRVSSKRLRALADEGAERQGVSDAANGTGTARRLVAWVPAHATQAREVGAALCIASALHVSLD